MMLGVNGKTDSLMAMENLSIRMVVFIQVILKKECRMVRVDLLVLKAGTMKEILKNSKLKGEDFSNMRI
jgi:hypothetical protein